MASKAKSRYSIVLVERHLITKAVEANVGQLPHLEAPCLRLQGMLEELQGLLAEQDQLKARKQEITRRIHLLEDQTGKLAAFLKSGVRENYGTRSEKLAEFGLQPFRGRRREKPAVEEPESAEPLTDPAAPKRNTP